MKQLFKSFNIRDHFNTRLKHFTLYIILVTVLVVAWIQFDNLKQLNNYEQPGSPQFSTSEIDPATWSIQIQENETIILQRSIFPTSAFSSSIVESHLPFVTAIITRVDDSHDGILHAIQHLLKYPFIKEIYIYNQVKSKPLVKV